MGEKVKRKRRLIACNAFGTIRIFAHILPFQPKKANPEQFRGTTSRAPTVWKQTLYYNRLLWVSSSHSRSAAGAREVRWWRSAISISAHSERREIDARSGLVAHLGKRRRANENCLVVGDFRGVGLHQA